MRKAIPTRFAVRAIEDGIFPCIPAALLVDAAFLELATAVTAGPERPAAPVVQTVVVRACGGGAGTRRPGSRSMRSHRSQSETARRLGRFRGRTAARRRRGPPWDPAGAAAAASGAGAAAAGAGASVGAGAGAAAGARPEPKRAGAPRATMACDLALGDDPRRLVRDDDGREVVAGTQFAQRDLLAVAHDPGVPFLRVLVREHAIPLRPSDDDAGDPRPRGPCPF